MDVWDNTTTSDGGLNQGVKLFVTTDGELQVTWCDTLHLQVLGCVAGQLEDFGSQVFEDGGRVDSSGGTDTASGGGSELKVTVDTSHGELTHKNSGGEEKKVRIHFSKKAGEMEKRVGKGIIELKVLLPRLGRQCVGERTL